MIITYYLVLFCLDRGLIREPLEAFVKKLFALANEFWLVDCWQALEENIQINALLFTGDGEFNPIFNDTKEKILGILDEVYKPIFSSKLLELGVKVFYKSECDDDNEGDIFGRWEYETTIPFYSEPTEIPLEKSLTVRISEGHWGELTTKIHLSGDTNDSEESRPIWHNFYLIYQNPKDMSFDQYYLIIEAYAKNLVKFGFDIVSTAVHIHDENERRGIYSRYAGPDFFFNCLKSVDPSKAREFTRGFAFSVLNIFGEVEFDSRVKSLNRVFDLVDSFLEREEELHTLLQKTRSLILKNLVLKHQTKLTTQTRTLLEEGGWKHQKLFRDVPLDLPDYKAICDLEKHISLRLKNVPGLVLEEVLNQSAFSAQDGHIIALDFFTEKETLPPSLGNLEYLKQLRIYGEKLNGLPETFDNLKRLEMLVLDHTKFGDFPPQFFSLPTLKILKLHSTKLHSLPEALANLQTLEILIISSSDQMGEFPESIMKLVNLKEFGYTGSDLKVLPDSIGNLTQLKILELNYNQLQTIPESIGNLTSLESLGIHHNRLRTLPKTIVALKKLTSLHVEKNAFGNFPPEIEAWMMDLKQRGVLKHFF